APTYVWLLLIALLALSSVLTHGGWRRGTRIAFGAVFAVVIIQLVAFSVAQVRSALYPHLDTHFPDPLDLSATSVAPAMSKKEFGQSESAPPPEAKPEAPEEAGSISADDGARRFAASPNPRRMVIENYADTSVSSQLQKQLPADALIQTGPGIPEVGSNTLQLTFSGPVVQEHQVEVWLIGPWIMRALTTLRLCALIALALLFALKNLDRFPGGMRGLPARRGTKNPRRNRRRDPLAVGLVLVLAGVLAPR